MEAHINITHKQIVFCYNDHKYALSINSPAEKELLFMWGKHHGINNIKEEYKIAIFRYMIEADINSTVNRALIYTINNTIDKVFYSQPPTTQYTAEFQRQKEDL